MQNEELERLGQVQKERLAYIELRLYFLGDVRRQDLMDRFGIAPAVATRDFATYRELFPQNLDFDQRSKCYITGSHFTPAFKHVPERVLTTLSRGFGDGVNVGGEPLLRCELPTILNQPSLEVLAPVTRAIHRSGVVRLTYFSHSSGRSNREIIPFAMVNDGLRWHARAFDRKSGEFRDFVFTRMEDPVIVDTATIKPHERPDGDDQWNRIVNLELVPHPDRDHPEITEMDFGMEDGMLKVRLRAATAGYVLRHWNIDCSDDHSMKGPEYRLWLKEPLALFGVKNALLAPGYTPPR